MLQGEVLVSELLSVDRLSSGSVSASEVSSWQSIGYYDVIKWLFLTLDHEVLDDTVELGSLVSEALGASGELEEVLGGLGHVISEETDHDTALLKGGVISKLPG